MTIESEIDEGKSNGSNDNAWGSDGRWDSKSRSGVYADDRTDNRNRVDADAEASADALRSGDTRVRMGFQTARVPVVSSPVELVLSRLVRMSSSLMRDMSRRDLRAHTLQSLMEKVVRRDARFYAGYAGPLLSSNPKAWHWLRKHIISTAHWQDGDADVRAQFLGWPCLQRIADDLNFGRERYM
jgi:hypothetical protein